MPPTRPLEEILSERFDVDHDTGCWVWTGTVHQKGYGHLRHAYKTYRVHRLVYELYVEPIPEGLQIDHLCRNRACLNPDHLEPVTPQENSLRGLNGRLRVAQPRCHNGHRFDEKNTYLNSGRRHCRKCRNATMAQIRAQRKVAA